MYSSSTYTCVAVRRDPDQPPIRKGCCVPNQVEGCQGGIRSASSCWEDSSPVPPVPRPFVTCLRVTAGVRWKAFDLNGLALAPGVEKNGTLDTIENREKASPGIEQRVFRLEDLWHAQEKASTIHNFTNIGLHHIGDIDHESWPKGVVRGNPSTKHTVNQQTWYHVNLTSASRCVRAAVVAVLACRGPTLCNKPRTIPCRCSSKLFTGSIWLNHRSSRHLAVGLDDWLELRLLLGDSSWRIIS
jgi:hypothetical protein